MESGAGVFVTSTVGTLRSTTATSSKMSTQNITSYYRNFLGVGHLVHVAGIAKNT